MIELQHISKTFKRGEINEVLALQDINLTLDLGCFLVLIGANGSGKTTLLNSISGAVIPSTGKIFLKGQEVTNLPEHRRSKWIARIFQDPYSGTAPDLSILDNFRLAALRTQTKKLKIGITDSFRKKVQDHIAELGLGLEDKLQQPMGTLSGGQRQALTLLMGVMDDTDILLLDEPTAALDPYSAEVVLSTAKRIIQTHGLTTIMITHNLKEALAFGNRLIQMSQGKIVRDLQQAEKSQLQLEEMYTWFG